MVWWRAGWPASSQLTFLSKIFTTKSTRQPNQTKPMCWTFQRPTLALELPSQQCVRKQRKLSKLILFSQNIFGRISHESTRTILGSLCTNQFAQRQCFWCSAAKRKVLVYTSILHSFGWRDCRPLRCSFSIVWFWCLWLFSDSISINLLWKTAVKARTMQASLTLVGFSNIGEKSSLVPKEDQYFLSFCSCFSPQAPTGVSFSSFLFWYSC